MATAKKKEKKSARNLTKSEYDKLFKYIGNARVMCRKISKDAKYTTEVRRALASIEKKLWNIGNDYYWGRLTDYKR